jgi:tRNA A37 threonylcarbamoyladenosine biosynthesis protein TsaE
MAGVLIERAGFLASLEGLLGEALDGSGRLVFLGGEAGVGKTTLAAALADAARVAVRRGSPMPTVTCTPASRTAPTATSTPGGCT